MAIAFDAVSNATPGTSTLSWTHTPVGTPRGVVVFVMQYNNGTDQVTGVTYGGTAMTEVTGSPLLKTSGEAMAVYCYFLGAAVPTGAQTVQVSVNATGSDKAAVCYSVTGADTITVQEADATITSDAVANPSTTLALGGREAFCAIGFCAGGVNVAAITPLTNWTSSYEYDAGAEQLAAYRYNTIGTTDVTAGWTQGEDDALAIAIAIREATLLVTKSEGVTLGDTGAAALADALAVSKSEGVTVGESATVQVKGGVQPDRDVNVTDGLTVGESNSQALADISTSVTDGITLADVLPGHYVDNITLGEVVTVSLGVLADFEITVSDGITLGESNSQALDDLAVSQAEGVTVEDAATASLPDDLAISHSEGVTVADAATVQVQAEGEYYISVSDGITLGEAATTSLPDALSIGASDGVTLGEAVTVSLPEMEAISISVADGVTLGEAITTSLADLAAFATDGLAIGDVAAASLADALVISLFEGVTLGESTFMIILAPEIAGRVTGSDAAVYSVAGSETAVYSAAGSESGVMHVVGTESDNG